VISQENPDTWALIGNMHLGKEEWQQAQKKFEKIIDKDRNDPYSLLSLGNVSVLAWCECNSTLIPCSRFTIMPNSILLKRRLSTSNLLMNFTGKSYKKTQPTSMQPME
jgi:hypothetical protein